MWTHAGSGIAHGEEAMKSSPVRALVTLLAAAAAAFATAAPAIAAPRLDISGLSVRSDHIDVTQGPGDNVLTFTAAGAHPDAREISGSVEMRQFAGASAVGPVTTVPYDAALIEAGSGSTTVRVFFGVPRYGATADAVWRITRLTARDDHGTERVLRGDGLPAFGVTQLVDAGEPVLDQVALGPDQSPYVVDAGAGAQVDYRVVATDLQAGIWKGRLTVAGPDGVRVSAGFAVSSDGRHLTCGTSSLIDDIFDHVECSVPVVVTAGTWTVARVALTDQAGNTRVVNRPEGPTVYVTRG
jgi:hypothetical protein